MLPRIVQRTGVVNNKVGGFDFLFLRQLRRHAPRDFAAGSFFVHFQPGRPALDALLGAASDDHQTVEMIPGPGFQNQSSFYHRDGAWIAPAHLLHPFVLPPNHGGMNNLVQFLYARGSRVHRRSESCFRQPGTIDAAVRIENSCAEMAHDFLIDRLTRLHEVVGDGVGLNQVGAQRNKHLAHHGLARSNSAG